jgi:cytochrome P450
MMPYGSTWKAIRKLTRMSFGPERVKKYYRAQEDITALLLGGLLDTPKEYNSLFSL